MTFVYVSLNLFGTSSFIQLHDDQFCFVHLVEKRKFWQQFYQEYQGKRKNKFLQRALSMTEYVCSCHFHAQGQQASKQAGMQAADSAAVGAVEETEYTQSLLLFLSFVASCLPCNC